MGHPQAPTAAWESERECPWAIGSAGSTCCSGLVWWDSRWLECRIPHSAFTKPHPRTETNANTHKQGDDNSLVTTLRSGGWGGVLTRRRQQRHEWEQGHRGWCECGPSRWHRLGEGEARDRLGNQGGTWLDEKTGRWGKWRWDDRHLVIAGVRVRVCAFVCISAADLLVSIWWLACIALRQGVLVVMMVVAVPVVV